jgi:hypothetical protein
MVVAAPRPPDSASTAAAKCKAGQVQVKLGKKRACRPLAKALPPPRAVDTRLAHLRQVLKFDPAKTVRGKKRKRARTLQSGFGSAGKRAQKKLLRLLPKALAFVDRKRGARRSSVPTGFGPSSLTGLAAASSAIATASAGCNVGPAGPRGSTGGATIGMLGNNGGFVEAPTGTGLTVRVTWVSCGGASSFRVPECPTANGTVEAPPASGDFQATVEVRDGNRVVSRNSSHFEDKSKAVGKVAADAKLDHVDVEHRQVVLIVASGGIVIRAGVERKVRINMRTGKYDPNEAAVVYFGDQIGDMGGAAFSRSADAAISSFRSAEARWSDFARKPHCAEPVFSPASESLKLRKDQTGQLSVYAKARDGGRATGARWELLGAENATFNPTSSQDPGPTISYSVTNAPPGGRVRVTVKFTSTAGVGEGTWTQPTEDPSFPSAFNSTVSGTADYDAGELGEGNSLDANFGGTIALKFSGAPPGPGSPTASYTIQSGSINYSYDGHVGDCDVSGSDSINLATQPDLANFPALLLIEGTPRQYQYVIPMPLFAKVVGVQESCEDPEEEGDEFEWFPAAGVPAIVNTLLPGGPVGPDWGATGSNSGNNGPGSPDQTWQWTLSPIP